MGRARAELGLRSATNRISPSLRGLRSSGRGGSSDAAARAAAVRAVY